MRLLSATPTRTVAQARTSAIPRRDTRSPMKVGRASVRDYRPIPEDDAAVYT